MLENPYLCLLEHHRETVYTVHTPDCALLLSGEKKTLCLTFLQFWWSGNFLLAILEDTPLVPIYISEAFKAMSLGILQVNQSTVFYSVKEKMFTHCVFCVKITVSWVVMLHTESSFYRQTAHCRAGDIVAA
jgi:hypothetical protein